MSLPPFRLTDTQSRQVKELTPVEPGHLRFYTCGPTVYSYAHIGNFRTFLTGDLIVRTAKALGWRVTYVTNITDVGHLTSDDAEGGEDRMEKGLKSKEGERFANVWDMAEHYADELEADWQRLNLLEPTVRPKATQHMREQILAAEELIEKGYAYETPTGVYFSVEAFAGYGKLSGNTQENLRAAVRDVVLDDNKRQQADFALWKKDEKHLMQWFSPWGWGFPGWHLECSVMARAYLGDTIDLHAGGEDLIFPHHECEIAQSEALTGKPFANHWVHTRFLQVNGEKMSKSAGNFYTVRDLLAKGAEPLAIRYALIAGNYGKPLNFTDDSLAAAAGNVERLRRAEAAAKSAIEAGTAGEDVLSGTLGDLGDELLGAMCNDLNTPVALAKALEGARAILREAEGMSAASGQSALAFVERVNDLLGIVRNPHEQAVAAAASPEAVANAAWVEERIAERAAAKKAKDFARADAIRAEVEAAGIELRDTPDGTVWVAKG